MVKKGGVTDWHKQQHKKQVQKNKEARIAARDERVVQEKTVNQVRDEIRQVERHHKNVEQRPHAIKSKLDRLQKELKLLQASADKAKEERLKQPPKSVATVVSQQTDYVELERPQVSVYYDAVMNPYGAPPPGQPRLFHRRGGGTTMDLAEACTRDEQLAPPLKVPPPPNAPPPKGPPPPPPHRSAQGQHKPNPSATQTRRPPPNRSVPVAVPPPPQSVNQPIDPSLPPTLPLPSASVQRCFKKSTVDIWASTEEVEYEAVVSSVALEGVVAPPAPPTAAPVVTASRWYYQDTSGAIQGPYPTDQMKGWVQAGFFPLTTRISADPATGPWLELDQVHVLTGAAEPKRAARPESSIQDRIAALRQSANDSAPTVEDRIAALREERVREQNEQDVQTETSVQDRIAALKAGNDQSTARDEDEENGGDAETGEEHSNALRAQHDGTTQSEVHSSTEMPPPPPPPPPPLHASIQNEDRETFAVAPYPLDEESAVPYMEYPVDDSYDVPYPIDEADDDVPVTGEYETMDDSYYPAEPYDDTNPDQVAVPPPSELPPKKKIRVDKAVMALLPSHLRQRNAPIPR